MASRFQFALPDPRPRDGWFRVGNLDITTTALLVIGGVATMFLYAISTSTFGRLVFFPDLVRGGEVWRLITWPFANQPDIFPVITLFFFWRVGHFVEEMLGRNRYAVLMGLVTVVPAAIVSLLDQQTFPTYAELGLGLLLTVAFVVFAVENPEAQSWFGIPVWVIAAVFTGIYVLQVTAERYWGTLIMLLIAIVVGLITVRQWGFAERLSFIPNVGSRKPYPPRRGPAPARPSGRRSGGGGGGGAGRRSGQVVEGPWSAPTPPRSSAEIAAAQAELDGLLDKISATGLDSLTADEKRRLNDLSKRLR